MRACDGYIFGIAFAPNRRHLLFPRGRSLIAIDPEQTDGAIPVETVAHIDIVAFDVDFTTSFGMLTTDSGVIVSAYLNVFRVDFPSDSILLKK